MREKRIGCFRAVRSISLKSFLRLKRTTPHTETTVVENKPKVFVEDGTWGCLHFYAIQSIVRHASRGPTNEFRKFLHTASLLNKHWKAALDDIVDHLDVRTHWHGALEALLNRFSNARRLRLTSIDGEALLRLQEYPQVEELELYAVDFSSVKTVKSLSKLRYLKGLKFRNSPSLDDKALKAVVTCANLRHLDLTGCSLITGQGVKMIGQLTQLVQLYLGDCTSLTADGLHALTSLVHLETLNLSGIQSVGDSVLHALSSLPRLTDLDIFMCPNVTDIGLWYLAKKVQLRSLNLFSCDKITDEGLRAIAQQTALQKLNLGWCCLITDYGIRTLTCLKHLCELRLSCVPITFHGLLQLSQLKSLSFLDARGCDINSTKLTEVIGILRSTLPPGQLTVLCS